MIDITEKGLITKDRIDYSGLISDCLLMIRKKAKFDLPLEDISDLQKITMGAVNDTCYKLSKLGEAKELKMNYAPIASNKLLLKFSQLAVNSSAVKKELCNSIDGLIKLENLTSKNDLDFYLMGGDGNIIELAKLGDNTVKVFRQAQVRNDLIQILLSEYSVAPSIIVPYFNDDDIMDEYEKILNMDISSKKGYELQLQAYKNFKNNPLAFSKDVIIYENGLVYFEHDLTSAKDFSWDMTNVDYHKALRELKNLELKTKND